MKIGFCADVHIGNHRRHGGPNVAGINQRCALALGVYEKAVKRAAKIGCETLFVLGDLVDCQRPEAQVLRAIQRIHEGVDMRVVVMLGNHEMTSSHIGDNALGPLTPTAHIIERPTVVRCKDKRSEVAVALVPFQPGAPPSEWLDEAIKHALQFSPLDIDAQVLGIHLGVSDLRTPPWLVGSTDSIDVGLLSKIAYERGIKSVFAGNWHDRRFWAGDPSVFQLGALVPTGWDNPGLEGYGTLGVWEDGETTYEEIPGPRFLKSTPASIATTIERARLDDHEPFIEVRCPPDQLQEARASLSLFGAGGEVVPDTAEAVASARTAASAARSAETLDEALAAFVANMPLPEGVEAAEVHTRAQGYLRA